MPIHQHVHSSGSYYLHEQDDCRYEHAQNMKFFRHNSDLDGAKIISVHMYRLYSSFSAQFSRHVVKKEEEMFAIPGPSRFVD